MYSAQADNRSHIRWLTGHFAPYWKRATFSALLVTIRSVLLLCPPLLVRYIIDEVLTTRNGSLLTLASLGIFAVPVVTGTLIILDLYVSSIALRVAAAVRADLYDGLQHRPFEWFAHLKAGDLISRMHRETEQAFLFVYQGFGSLVWFNVTIMVGLGIMAWLDWRLTFAVIGLLVVQSWGISGLSEKVRKTNQELAAAQAEVVERVRESISGAVFIKHAGREDSEIAALAHHLDRHFRAYQHNLALDRLASVLKSILAGLVPATLYLWGGLRVMNGLTSVGSVVALVSYYSWIQPAVFGYQSIYLSAKRVSGNVARIREICFPVPAEGGCERPEFEPAVSVKHVSFSYDQERPVLRDVSLTIPAGSTIAIVGPSGSGKSTLADLILGFRIPDDGQVLIGESPLAALDPVWLRQNVLAVSQEVQLRGGTLRENLIYGNPEATDDEVAEALRVTALQEWVSGLPEGLATYVGEQGLKISGGERQRLSLARAVLAGPAVLILDEATSALDSLTERHVMRELRQKLKGCALVIIAHRVSAVANADQIYVLKDGAVVESGSHVALMKAEGVYADLYERQTRHGR